MAGDKHITALVEQVRASAPRFGRARVDLEAIASRAHGGDFRGVLQNTRLVVETLLRAIFAKKKQTPGKQTLEQLVSKLQQDLPTHIQVHVRTIQAWGNVSAHDHSADLSEPGLNVGLEEARAALSSLVVILRWFEEVHLDPSTTSAPAAAASNAMPAAHAGRTSGSNPAWAALGILFLAGLGAAGWWVLGHPASSNGGHGDDVPALEVSRQALSAYYADEKEPEPPKACRSAAAADAAVLARSAERLSGGARRSARPADRAALSLLESVREDLVGVGEYWGLVATARYQAGKEDDAVLEAIDAALSECGDFAQMHSLKGNLHFLNRELKPARAAFDRALTLAPDYLAPRFNLGLVLVQLNEPDAARAAFDAVLKRDPDYEVAYQARGTVALSQQRHADAIRDLEEATRRDPDGGRAFYLLGHALEAEKRPREAEEAFCRARALGEKDAAERCPR